MVKQVLIFALLSTVGLAAVQSDKQPAIGIVKSESGKPLSDALVCAKTYKCLISDSEGRYDLAQILPKAWERYPIIWIFRFSKEGDKPLLKTLESATSSLDATLIEGSSTSWDIPACRGKEKQEGFGIKVLVPGNSKVSNGDPRTETGQHLLARPECRFPVHKQQRRGSFALDISPGSGGDVLEQNIAQYGTI